MAPDATATVDAQEAEVMASVDSSADTRQLVIADVTRDDAWIAVSLDDAASLPAWR